MGAIKVLPMSSGQDSRLETRFFSEMRVVAQLRHQVDDVVGAHATYELFGELLSVVERVAHAAVCID